MPVRRRLIAVLLLALVALPLALAQSSRPGRTELCAEPATPLRIGSTVACVHSDEAPPGVDVTERPSTAELLDRPGVGEAAYAAAEELGVPAPVEVATTATGPGVTCDGDGTSGYRVQAMYVVEAGKANRYAALLNSLRTWAAGTDDVVNRSAALTGGVRHIRYVTTPGAGGTCVADVLNVTVPNGSMTSFGATVSAVQALGYTDRARKYLMWTDATALCGVASMYTNDGASQTNPNNGTYPQYARIDSGCWGYGDGAGQHSVEAHELLHMLGGVQNSAPHSTKAGHCNDESDSMCYADGGSASVMRQICPTSKEYFFDCNNDDYFSTYPAPGSYLATHWNAADSRFLIGGGDGTAGGSLGTPTTLGATIAVNNPAVPGLATQASVAPQLPTGRTVTSVAWTAKRADCTFGTPTQLQTTVTCAATATGSTSVTVTLQDSSGASKTVTSPLTFSSGPARPVTLTLGAAGQTGANASVCTGAAFPLVATVIDEASGQPIKGLAVPVTRKTAALAQPASAGTATTGLDGRGTLTQTAAVATTYAARTNASAVYAAASPVSVLATPSTCEVALTSAADTANVYYGDPVTVSGRVTRQVLGLTVPVIGLGVPVKLTTAAAKVIALGTAVTGLDGRYSLVVKPTASGALAAVLPASAAYLSRTAPAGDVTVTLPESRLTGAVDRTDVGYGSPVTVSGRLDRVAGDTVTPLKGTVTVSVTPPGKPAVRVGSGAVSATGAYSFPVALKASGTLAVSYAGAAGQPATSVVVGDVTAGTWTTHLTSAASSLAITRSSTTTTVSGTVTRTYGGLTQPAPGLRVSILFTPSGSTVRSTLGRATTSAAGLFSARVAPRSSGTLNALLAAVAGYREAVGDPLLISFGKQPVS